MISERRSKLRLGSDPISLVCGTLILLGVMGIAIATPRGIVLGFYPIVGALGLALMASGFRHIGQYRNELFGLLCLGLPKLISLQTFDLSPLTASFATTLMWYAGFPVQRDGIRITLPPNNELNVVPECSGLNLMLYMFGVSVVFLMLFPTSKRRNLILFPALAVGLGFFLNAIRIALLTFVNTSTNRSAFDYWHGEEGALFFVLLSVGVFGLLCWVLLGLEGRKKYFVSLHP
ncbi:MAG: cyanoexosortase A [Acaryochloridaceae cyanobacterium RL_2_7]|nr:cyanoexosortase A [Acaryochloridaceae cyanobacterium RL_2_7]